MTPRPDVWRRGAFGVGTLLLIAAVVLVASLANRAGSPQLASSPTHQGSGSSGIGGGTPASRRAARAARLAMLARPAGLIGVSENRQAFLSWNPPLHPKTAVHGYVVLRDGAQIAQVTGTTFTDVHLVNGVAHTYAIEAQELSDTTSPPSQAVRVVPKVPTPLGVAGNWRLKFDDEFDSTSLDLSKWSPNWFGHSNASRTYSFNSHDDNCDNPQNVSEGGGLLTLSATAGPCAIDGGPKVPDSGGLISSYGKYTFTYGYLEARMYVPASSNGMPIDSASFWADGNNWPVTGELDVMEVLAHCKDTVAWHFHSSTGSEGDCIPLSPPAGWHTFGADWQPGVITYYYDGRLVGRAVLGITSAPMYLILAFGVNPRVGGPVALPAKAFVKYVRVWQQPSPTHH